MKYSSEECKRLISKLGFKLGVSPKLVITRLLSDLDKDDMMAGLIEIEALESHIRVWMGNRMPDYAHGKTDAYKPSFELPMQRYRGYGK